MFGLDSNDPDIKRKVFIGGLAMHSSEESIKAHFGSSGFEVEAINLVQDKQTGRSRGFGFITFKDPNVIDSLLSVPQIIDQKRVDIKRATVQKKAGQVYTPSGVFATRKMFCGGLPPEITRDQIIEYFTNYGGVTDAIVMCDKNSGRPRGFGFVIFDQEDSVEKVISNYADIKIFGKWVECKRAAPRDLDLTKAHQQNGIPFNQGIQPQQKGLLIQPSSQLSVELVKNPSKILIESMFQSSDFISTTNDLQLQRHSSENSALRNFGKAVRKIKILDGKRKMRYFKPL